MTSACVKWGHALGFSGSLGEFDKLSLNFEVKVTSPRSKLPRGALSEQTDKQTDKQTDNQTDKQTDKLLPMLSVLSAPV